jgi:ketosteroid isomerase-like protein
MQGAAMLLSFDRDRPGEPLMQQEGAMNAIFRHKRSASATALQGLAFLSVTAMPWAVQAQSISDELRHKTEMFSNAGQQGDGQAMARMLDDRVVFFNEGGDQASKADMASATPSTTSGVSTRMTITDWHCEVHGDVAVASFIDDQQQDFHGQPFHARYRSVETWLKEPNDWRMISSETIALADDPAAVTLSAAVLDEYVGSYEAAPGVRFTFSRQGDTLLASTGGPLQAQKAEVRDVFFTPGNPRARKVFERDAKGRITGFALRREGHDILFRKV